MPNGTTDPYMQQGQAIGERQRQLAAPYFAQSQPASQPAPVDQKKHQWMSQAAQLNPTADYQTLGHIYDQKVMPAQMAGRDPWESEKKAQEREEKEGYQQIKNNLTPADTGLAKSGLLGLERGFKDIGQGIMEGTYQLRENPTARKVASALSEFPGMEPLKLLDAPVPEGTTAAYRDHVNKQIDDYDEQTKNHPIAAGGARLVGSLIASLPTGDIGEGVNILKSTLTSKLLQSGAQGATISGLQYDPTGEGRAYNSIIGGVLGAAMGGTFHAFTSMYKWLKGAPALIDDPAVLNEAANEVKKSKALGLDQLTAGAATKIPSIQNVESQMLKAEGPGADLFRQAHEKLSNQIYDAGQNMIKAVGGKPIVDNIAGEEALKEAGGKAQTAINDLRGNVGSAISNMYETAGKAPGWATQVDRSGILDAHNDVMNDFIDMKFSPSTTKQIEDMGETVKNGDYKNAFSVKDANELIKKLNKTYSVTTQKDYKAAISILKSNIFDSLDKLADDKNNPSASLFNMARQIRREMGNVYDDGNIVSTIRKMRGKSSNYIKPEEVSQKIFGARTKISDLNDIEKSLTYIPPVDKWMSEAKRLNSKIDNTQLQQVYENDIVPQATKGRELWNDIKSAKLNDIMNKATIWNNGTPQLNYQRLVGQWKQVGKPGMGKLLGTPELASKFEDLINVMDRFQNKPRTMPNIERAGNSLKRLVQSIFVTMGAKEDGGGLSAISYHIPVLGNMLKHIADESWVKSNLSLGRQTESDYSLLIKKEPQVAHNITSRLANLAATQPQGGAAYSNNQAGGQ